MPNENQLKMIKREVQSVGIYLENYYDDKKDSDYTNALRSAIEESDESQLPILLVPNKEYLITETITSEAIDFEEDEVGTLDYGLNIGVSYVLNEMIAINAGYSLGLADLNAEGGEFDGEDYSKKTNGIYFSVGYLFGGGY